MKYSDYISKTDAKNLIAQRTRPRHENMRAWANKIDGKLKTQIKNKKIAIDDMGNLYFNDLAAYAKAKYPGQFDDLPVMHEICIEGVLDDVVGSVAAVSLPASISDCHSLIVQLSVDNRALQSEIERLNAEIVNLKPDAERYREIRSINKRNGGKKRQKF